MTELKLETQGANTFLVLSLDEDDILNEFEYGMLRNNSIKGILPVFLVEVDDRRIIKYNISSRTSLQNFLSGEVSRNTFLTILKKLQRAFEDMQDYMLELSDLCLEYENIYVNLSKMDIEFVCIPVEREREEVDLKAFFRNLIFSMKYRRDEDRGYVVRLIDFVNSPSPFSITEFGKLLDKLETVHSNESSSALSGYYAGSNNDYGNNFGTDSAVSGNSIKSDYTKQENSRFPFNIPLNEVSMRNPELVEEEKSSAKEKKSFSLFHKEKKEKKKADKKNAEPVDLGFQIPGKDNDIVSDLPQSICQPEKPEAPVPKKKYGLFRKKSKKENEQKPEVFQNPSVQSASISEQPISSQKGFVVNKDGKLISETNLPTENSCPYVVRMRTGERMEVRYSSLKIGRKRDFVDFYIADNPAVGRNHANIIQEGNGYRIVDNNSVNHTYVEGVMIEPGKSAGLNHGTRFVLANEEFTFYLY